MSKIRIIIADVSEAFIAGASAYLACRENIDIIGTCRNGFELVSMVKTHAPDVVVMNLVLEELDGVAVMEKLRRMDTCPPLLVCTEFCNDLTIHCAQTRGAAGYLCKPVLLESLYHAICECAKAYTSGISASIQPDTGTDAILMDRLAYLGISAGCSGYSMLLSAVRFALKDPDAIKCLNRRLYPMIADFHNTTLYRVERNIRSAIKSAFSRGMITGGGKAPTNKQFIVKLIHEIKSRSSTL